MFLRHNLLDVVIVYIGDIQRVKRTLNSLAPIETAILINNEDKIGVPAIYNRALDKTTARYVMFIHDDVEIFDPKWQEKMMQFLIERPEVGILGLSGRKTIMHNGMVDENTTCHNIWHLIKDQTHKPMQNQFEQVAAIDGLGFIIRADIGLRFDEQYGQMHYYDLDISMQAKDKGYQVWVANIECEHWGDIEGNYRQHQWYKEKINDVGLFHHNRQIFLNKWRKYFNQGKIFS